MTICQLQHELELTKEMLERSKMKEEEMIIFIEKQNLKIEQL